MSSIHLSNSKNRDATVATKHIFSGLRLRWVDAQGRVVNNVRVLSAPLPCELPLLARSLGSPAAPATLEQVGQAILDGDPEIDFERTGSYLRDTSRVYINPGQQIVSAVAQWDLIKSPDGSLRERKPHQPQEQNVDTEAPLRYSGKLFKKAEVYNRFVFAAKLQVQHQNGLTYDFLFDLARELEQKDSLLLVGAGPKSSQPLIFSRGGTPYRGFLEGRTRNDSYCLLLHLANLELKLPSK